MVQEVRSTGRLAYKKVLGTLNPADILTKYVPGDLLDSHIKTLNVEVRCGRAESAPSLDALEKKYEAYWHEETEESGRAGGEKERKRLSFSNRVGFVKIPAVGLQRPVYRKSKLYATSWRAEFESNFEKGRKSWADETDEELGLDYLGACSAHDGHEDDWEEVEEEARAVKTEGEIAKGVSPAPAQTK